MAAAIAVPVATTLPAIPAEQVVKVEFKGPPEGWDEYIERKVIDALREAIDGKDVILFGPKKD